MTMPYSTFIVPREIFHGPGALESLTTVPGQRFLIVTDAGVRASGTVERVQKVLQARKAESTVFDKVQHDPSKAVVRAIFEMAQSFKPDVFIGLGGGSSMDAGKVGWVFYEHPDLAELPIGQVTRELAPRQMRRKARYVAIATSSGTGSETTRAAVVTNEDETPPYKAVVVSPQIIPDVAIVDAELAASMPPDVTANTGFDAFVHAVECYVLTQPSQLVDPLAIGAARTILEWLPKAVADGKNIEARDKMHVASLEAGMAFSNGRLGLVHGLAHQIGADFSIPHGRANAFMLDAVFAFFYPVYKSRFSHLAEALGISGKTDADRANKLLVRFDELKKQVGIPLSIKQSGLKPDLFTSQVGPISQAFVNHWQPAVAQLTPDARRATGMAGDVDEVKSLFMHAWNGTRPDIK
jgi:alcohol dehydrogenase class IV